MSMALLTLLTIAELAGRFQGQPSSLWRSSIDLPAPSEVVASIDARCDLCDWRVAGREAVLLELRLDGEYSQHVALVRGTERATFRVLLGSLPAGHHELSIAEDERRSSPDAGHAHMQDVRFESFGAESPEFDWLSRAPVLRARPGTIERFSDFPLVMYVERNAGSEGPAPYALQYTTIFSNEDGGTPADRLMATWGRTTDIEFVYGVTLGTSAKPARQVIQIEGHRWVDFAGRRFLGHPELWVATENNMVADHGADDLIRFAPAPVPISLDGTSREHVMDVESWTYRVTSEEMLRERRVGAPPLDGNGQMADPRRYAVIEACGSVVDAGLVVDVAVRGSNGRTDWYSSDLNLATFRISRSGCFRAGIVVPAGTIPSDVEAIRVRATDRSSGSTAAVPHARVVLTRINEMLMLGPAFEPLITTVGWSGQAQLEAGSEGFRLSLPR